MSILNISNNACEPNAFASILKNVTPEIKCIRVDPRTLTWEQRQSLLELTGKNHLKGLKIVAVTGEELSIHSNWDVYSGQKEQAYVKGMHETTSIALNYFKRIQKKIPDFVLDFGAGTGQDTINLAFERCPKIWAIDADENSLAILQKHVNDMDFASQITCFNIPFITIDNALKVDLLVASYSLPYRSPADFPAVWEKCVTLIKPGGLFSGHFFGPVTGKEADPGMTFHTKEELIALIEKNFLLIWFRNDQEGQAFKVFGSNSTPEWGNLYHVVAEKKEG